MARPAARGTIFRDLAPACVRAPVGVDPAPLSCTPVACLLISFHAREFFRVKPTDVRNPDYFHKVVDCQWACPGAHQRAGVHPADRAGALRPTPTCSTASRTSSRASSGARAIGRASRPAAAARVEEKPVAICRMKRVAADLQGRRQRASAEGAREEERQARRLHRRGPRVAHGRQRSAAARLRGRDLREAHAPGRPDADEHPRFRLPAHVLDEEIAMIVDMGVDVRYGTPVQSMKALLDSGRLRRRLRRHRRAARQEPGHPRPPRRRRRDPHRHRLARERRLRSHRHDRRARAHHRRRQHRDGLLPHGAAPRRQGRQGDGPPRRAATSRPRPGSWRTPKRSRSRSSSTTSPKRFVIENGKLVGMEFERLEWDEDGKQTEIIDTVFIPADAVILAIGQENAFPWIERDIGIEFDKWDMPKVDKKTMAVHAAGRLLRRRRGLGTAEHHLGGRARPPGGDLDPQPLPGRSRSPSGRRADEPRHAEDGAHEWSYSNDYNPPTAPKMKHVDLRERFKQLSIEVEMGFTAEQTAREVERCLNCDVQTAFTDKLCIECDACIDVCPMHCLTITAQRRRAGAAQAPDGAGRNLTQALFVSGALPQTGRVMVKDEDVCVHCGLCAERCPTAAWDMARFELAPQAGTADEPGRPSTSRERHASRSGLGKVQRASAQVSEQRLRVQARQRQRHRIGERERPAHAGDLPDGDPRLGKEPVPLEHPGPADLVRDPGQQGTGTRRARSTTT